MTNLAAIKSTMAEFSQPRHLGEWVVIPTSCIYPSNRTVNIFVSGGMETFRAFDGGGAFDELDGMGAHDFGALRSLKKMLANSGLIVDQRGWIGVPDTAYEHLSSVIPYLANASLKASIALAGKRPKRRLFDLRAAVEKFLLEKYQSCVHPKLAIAGAGNKLHKFDFVVDMAPGMQLALDAALPEASSINAIVVRHLDVGKTDRDGFSQMIIYDDRDEDWKSEDIALLRTGGKAFAFSHLSQSLQRATTVAGANV